MNKEDRKEIELLLDSLDDLEQEKKYLDTLKFIDHAIAILFDEYYNVFLKWQESKKR